MSEPHFDPIQGVRELAVVMRSCAHDLDQIAENGEEDTLMEFAAKVDDSLTRTRLAADHAVRGMVGDGRC